MKPKTDADNDPRIVGVNVEVPDAEEVYRKAEAAWNRAARLAQRRTNQRIEFKHGPVCLSFVADLHIGSHGTDYPRMFAEAKTIADTPGLYLVLDGDLLDNFIIPKLIAARQDSHIPVAEEWALVRRYLEIVAPKLLISVRGNHERWSWILAGIDYFADVLRSVKASVIYDTDDSLVTLHVGAASFPLRVRHNWRGVSIYNDTHGIERAAKLDGDFIIGIGAHTHASGLVRTFNAQGRAGMAVLCGSYKRIDPFAREKGFVKPNASTAMSVLFFESGAMVGIDRLDVAADLMRRYRK